MPRPRLSIGTLMMVVLAAATASALFARSYQHLPTGAPNLLAHPVHVTAEFVLAIIVTGLTLAAWKQHSVKLALVQITLACLALLILISLMEWKAERLLIYWFQGCFIGLVMIPLGIRRWLKVRMPYGSERRARAQVCEAVAFAFLNMVLVLIGVFLQLMLFGAVENNLSF